MDDLQQEPQDQDGQVSESAPEEPVTEGQEADNPTPEDADQEEKVVFDDKQQEVFNKALGGKVAKQRDAERRADEAEAKLAEVTAQIPQKEAPKIPDIPNPEDFVGDPQGLQKAIEDRDVVIVEGAKFNADLEAQEADQQRQAQQQMQERADQIQEQAKSFVETAKSFGIKPEDVDKDGKLVSAAIGSHEIDDHIIAHKQGPLISKFLAKNPLECDAIRAMTPMQASLHIDKAILPKLAGMIKQTTAPDPPDILDGQGAPDAVPDSIKGATFK